MSHDAADREPRAIQLHVELPYKHEACSLRVVREHLDRGFRIAHLQRVTDREALVTLVKA